MTSLLPFDSLDFVYTPTADVDATADWYVTVLGARLDFKVKAMGTTVASVSIADDGPRILLAGHLHTSGPILVYRVTSYADSVQALREAGVEWREELEIPHGPCAVFERAAGRRLLSMSSCDRGSHLLRRTCRPVSEIRLVVQGDDLGCAVRSTKDRAGRHRRHPHASVGHGADAVVRRGRQR